MVIRRFFAFVVSLFILFSLPLNAANAASSWSITGSVSAGARTIVSASKSGYKSAVNIMPTAGRLGVKLIKMGRTPALVYAVDQLLDGVDWVLDPANNRIRYKDPSGAKDADCTYNMGKGYRENIKASAFCPAKGLGSLSSIHPSSGSIICTGNPNMSYGTQCTNIAIPDKYLPIEKVAAQVIKNAAAGHGSSQAVTRDTAVEMVVAGDFDADLLQGAVPTNDTKPLVPAVPGNRNGNVTHGSAGASGEESDGTMSGAAPGAQADAAKDAADASKKAADAAKDAAKSAQDAAAQAAADAKDLINSAIDQAIKDAATQAAVDAKTAADAAKAAADAAAERAAADAKAAKDAADIAVADANKRAAAAERAAAEAAADASKSAAEKAAAQAAADAAKAEAAAAQARAEAAEKAAAEAAAAKPEAKPFELPAFCSWAAPVCDFIGWFKEPPPADLPAGEVPFATTGDVGLDEVNRFEKRIDFSGQCPVNDFSFTMMGVTYAKPIPYHHLCGFLEQIAPWLLAMCYLGVAYFVVENI